MRDPRRGTPARDEAVPGRTARRAAARLLLALLVGASCTGEDMVEPYGPVRNLTGPGAEALTFPQHVGVKSLSDGQIILGSSAVLKRRNTASPSACGPASWSHSNRSTSSGRCSMIRRRA